MTHPPLSGRRVLVTGASGGIGAAVARRVITAGGQVTLLARRIDRLRRLTAELGTDAIAIPCDVTDPARLSDSIAEAARAMGGIDAIVANAGAAHMGHIGTGEPRIWREFFDLNVIACLSTVRYGLDHMIAPADVVLIGSTAAHRPTGATGIYAASKTAVTAAAESLRLELGPAGIRVCLLQPGRVDTEIGQHARLEAGGRHGTMGTAFTLLATDEVAEVVAFVLSRPANLALNTVVLRPVGQEFP
ncbi:SDR family oxidoreductase [Mycobacterium vicinigordonae]|uniref:SDR family oxidoreductase n=1 Tax=Mycobacterium vicinigordonae TaxID=1719132 RepID=A0A7D6E2M6_9MYCO|nr:SDR family oxidoreductase [Mycobacterium vicinigordonae]QLL09789.1 SDR family oxidoreductase [Mycobacterium vicinigordonae]